ncbi:MAG: hypothetical protein LQ343_006952 [Gyalolechia ehrenbergii]|nr:MAG: hypothetical protein LQ343_006952 [Gyalolechia ehrenbergii]
MTETAPTDPLSTAINQIPNVQDLQNGDSTSLRSLCATLHAQITAFLQEDVPTERLKAVQTRTRKSLAIIQEALDRYDLASLSLSYNGGKDCLVLLILYLSLLSTNPSLPAALPAIYIPPSHPFTTVTEFTLSSAEHYHLNLDIHSADESSKGSMKEAFALYLEKRPEVRAIFVGTRRTDPHGGKLSGEGFDVTDRGWPVFMRVHPVIDWHYAEVWAVRWTLKSIQNASDWALCVVLETSEDPVLRALRPGVYEPRWHQRYASESRVKG